MLISAFLVLKSQPISPQGDSCLRLQVLNFVILYAEIVQGQQNQMLNATIVHIT